MNKETDSPRLTYHLSFSSEDDALLREATTDAELKIVPYIRKQALEGSILPVDSTALRDRSVLIHEIIREAHMYTSNKKPSALIFGTDLTMLIELLIKLRDTEKELLREICLSR